MPSNSTRVFPISVANFPDESIRNFAGVSGPILSPNRLTISPGETPPLDASLAKCVRHRVHVLSRLPAHCERAAEGKRRSPFQRLLSDVTQSA